MSEIIDTGLGWWANEDWLMDEPGTMGEFIGGGDFPEEPYNPSTTSLSFNDLYIGTWAGHDAYAHTTTGGVFAAFVEGNPYPRFLMLSASPTNAFVFGYPDGYGPIFTGFVDDYDSVTGVYYDLGGQASNGPTSRNPSIPIFSTLREALDAFSSLTVYKLTSGYSVSCFIRWLNANQDELVAPILISTEEDYTKMSLNGETEEPGIVTGIQFGDMTFYINILLGHSGEVTSNVPYQDLTSTFPDGINITELFRAIATFAQIRFSDPYREGGISGPGGGGGSFDFTSTDIPIPTLPTVGAYNTGFISLYKPTDSELRALAAYLWSGPFDLDNFKKIFANPMDCILGLHIIPTAGSHPLGAASALTVGNISTGLSMQRLSEQYFELDCGTITIDPKWGTYLDYAPYSKLSLFLPYIGFVTISPDDCMGGTIRVVYHVDVLSGSCCVYVYCASNQGADSHTLYTFTGGCACDCPVTEGQYTNGLFGSLRGGIGLAAGLLSASPAGIMGGIEEAANAALSMVKPDVGRSGSFGGSAGLMGIQYPYLVLTIPKMCTPGGQNVYRGYPSFVTEDLGSINGYASVEITHMENMSATDDEVSEIMGLLGEGVIF